jgi:ATP-dependent DNA helicase RecG
VDIPNKVRDILGIMVDVNLRKEVGEEFLEILVEPYPYPVSYRGEYHFRSGSTKQELKGAALDKFLLRKQGRTWDGVPVPRVGIKDLSRSAIDTFRKLARQSRRLDSAVLRERPSGLIERLHLLDGKYLKRAAVLLFHPDPEQFVTGAFVKIGYFRTNVDLLYHDEIHGDLFTQVSSTMDLLLTKYLKAGISYTGIQRVESLPVPEAALREAVLNAILHKDYSSGTPVQISVYADRLMLWNPGELPHDWTVARLKAKHPSHPFNPGVANVFFRAGQIESWGRGIERIFSSCTTAGTPPPALRCEQNGLWVDFEFGPAADISSGEVGERTGEKAREKTRDKILGLIRLNPDISMETMASSLGLTRKGVEWQIRKLKQSGILRRVGPDKGGHWEIPV